MAEDEGRLEKELDDVYIFENALGKTEEKLKKFLRLHTVLATDSKVNKVKLTKLKLKTFDGTY